MASVPHLPLLREGLIIGAMLGFAISIVLLTGLAEADALTETDTLNVTEARSTAKLCTVHHSTESRYRGFGYDHLVHISNACDEPVSCVIRSSANPGHINVNVPGRRRISVITRRGSPSRKFSASVNCKPGGG